MSQVSEGRGAGKGHGLSDRDVPDDYPTALHLFWQAGGNVQRSYTTELLQKADGLKLRPGETRMPNLPPNWKVSRKVAAKAEDQRDFVLNLCHEAGYRHVPQGAVNTLLVAAQCPGDVAKDSLGMGALQATGVPAYTFSSQSAIAGMSLAAPQQQEAALFEVEAVPVSAAPPQASPAITATAAPPAGPADPPNQQKATKDRYARLLEALLTVEVVKHVEQIQRGLRGSNANANTLSSNYLMSLCTKEGPLMKCMTDPDFKPANRFADDSMLGIGDLDPSQAVPVGGDLQKWMREMKTMSTRAFQAYLQQTGVADRDPSADTVGKNPVVLYAVRLMIAYPWISPSLNGAMPLHVQSEPDETGMVAMPDSTQAQLPLSAVPAHMALLPPKPQAPASPQQQPNTRVGLLPQLPDELAQAAAQQKATSWYQAKAAQGEIFARKCEALRNVAQSMHAIEGMTQVHGTAEAYGKLDAILKRGIQGVENDQFYRKLLKHNKFTTGTGSESEEEGD